MRKPPNIAKVKIRKRYAVSALRDAGIREHYTKWVIEAIEIKWNEDSDGSTKWEIMRDSLTKSAI